VRILDPRHGAGGASLDSVSPSRRHALLLAIAAFGLAVAAGLARVATLGPLRGTDSSLLGSFAALNVPASGERLDAISHLADPAPFVVLLVAIVGVALVRHRPLLGLGAAVAMLGANATSQVLKPALAHPRFTGALGLDQISSASWPSGHATASMSLALAAVLVAAPAWRPALAAAGAAFATAVGCSIVVLTWHYPSDVLGGWLVAAAWALAAAAVVSAVERRPAPDRAGAHAALLPWAAVGALGVGVAGDVLLRRPDVVTTLAVDHTRSLTGGAALAVAACVLAGGMVRALRRGPV
jgi:membrane-associated phospholipid phosphatase